MFLEELIHFSESFIQFGRIHVNMHGHIVDSHHASFGLADFSCRRARFRDMGLDSFFFPSVSMITYLFGPTRLIILPVPTVVVLGIRVSVVETIAVVASAYFSPVLFSVSR